MLRQEFLYLTKAEAFWVYLAILLWLDNGQTPVLKYQDGWCSLPAPRLSRVMLSQKKINYSDASGHVGIVVEKEDGSGVETMSVYSGVHPERVARTNFGFRSEEHPVFRRYVGPGASI